MHDNAREPIALAYRTESKIELGYDRVKAGLFDEPLATQAEGTGAVS